MKAPLRSIFAKVAVCALLIAMTATAKAQIGWKVTPGAKAGIVIVLVAVGVGAGIGISYAVRHGHSLNGCAASGSDGLQLENKGDGQMYVLTGEVAAIKSGDRVRVSGKKGKKNGAMPSDFLVKKLNKDFGPCKISPTAP